MNSRIRAISSVLYISLAFAASAIAQSQDTVTLAPYATTGHPPLTEMSGIVPSVRYPGAYWVMNDSGDEPRIFAIDKSGKTIMPSWLSKHYFVDDSLLGKQPYPGLQIGLASNIDWEEIAIDGDDLYIADVGNNGNARRDLGIYAVTEPNPHTIDRARIAKWIPIAYPDQTGYPGERWQFDCEAVFVYNHKLYFITKNRLSGEIGKPDVSASLYRLDEMRTDRVNILTKIEEKTDLGGWVTGAALSPDGKTLAVLCNAPAQSVWLFDTPTSGDKFFSSNARRLVFKGTKQSEAVCFTSNEILLITNEQREMFEVRIEAFGK